jgi:hypothetical protein
VAFVAILGIVRNASAVIAYSTAGSTYAQNFDSLPSTPTNTSLIPSGQEWKDDTSTPGTGYVSIPGWYLWSTLDPDPPPATTPENGFNDHQRLRAGSGNSGTGSFYSFGVNSTTERALGSVSSNTTGTDFIGVRFTNTTGVSLTQFTLSYDGEQWRDGGAAAPNAQSLTFGYKVGAATVQESGYTTVSALNFTSPVFTNTGGGAAVVGNTAGKTSIGPTTVVIQGLSWDPGTDFWLRWSDPNDAGNDHGLAIDNLSFSAQVAVPEASSFLCVGLAGVMIHIGRKLFSKQAA